MLRRYKPVGVFLPVALFLMLAAAPQALGQPGQLRLEYTVEVSSVPDKLFHVTTEIRNIREPRLHLSLPIWTPGWYTVENYAKNILRFKVSDSKGAPVAHTMTRKQTWAVETKGVDYIKVEFDYRAAVLALNQAKIADDFAFFTGTQLFLLPEGHRRLPSTVNFRVPQGWNVVSALKETSNPLTFTSTDYDTLVDSPTQMGRFDLAKFEVDGKPHYFAGAPAGVFSPEKIEQMKEVLGAIALTQKDVFGALPYEKYVYFYFFTQAESNASGGLEHGNSFVAFHPEGANALPQYMARLAAHEFFHVWNVKRIRPAELWPYDYSREVETPLLWVSEGFTNYYAALTLYRAGLADRKAFLRQVGGVISTIEGNEARKYISMASASVSTWLGYDTPVAFSISYYPGGQNLAALLDLSIIHDTGGASSLDDVMRALYQSSYLKGKGFSAEDLIGIINRITKRDYHEFFRRHVWGVEVPAYNTYLGYAGFRLNEGNAGEIVEVPQPTPAQIKVREKWLKAKNQNGSR
ncbi:MAG TPA: hypothetical protein VE262_14205 [Blastocatellia bacterium]|nr:hypothetical protein [Blastocatellia bacterium]